jgi:hypothetical protein
MASIGACITFPVDFLSHSFKNIEVPLRTLPSFLSAHQVTPITHQNATRLNYLLGFTALAILQLGSHGRKM